MDFFDYFQLVLLALLMLIYAIRTLQLFLRGINIFVFGIDKMRLHGIIEILIYAGFALWAAAVFSLSLKFGYGILPEILTKNNFNSIYMKVAGAVLVFIGFSGVILATIFMKDSWRLGVDNAKSGNLITTGLLKFSRNPIYVSLEIYFLGTWMIYSNLLFLFFLIFAIVVIHYQILQEEKFLLNQYGSEYNDYIHKVRRYF